MMFSLAVQFSSVQFSHSVLSDSLRPHGLQHARLPCPSPAPELAQTHVHQVSDVIQPSHSLSSSSPPALNLSQHHDWSFSLAVEHCKYNYFQFSEGLFTSFCKNLKRSCCCQFNKVRMLHMSFFHFKIKNPLYAKCTSSIMCSSHVTTVVTINLCFIVHSISWATVSLVVKWLISRERWTFKTNPGHIHY